MATAPRRRAGIIGASGYTGAELLRLLAAHPALDVVMATADSQAGTPAAALYPSLAAAYPDLELVATDDAAIAAADGLDVVFMGLPHEASMALAPRLVGSVGCVVDLSAAYRLKDASLYPQWYGFAHDQPELLAEAVYGLPERHRKELVGARLVATPGCYVTAATLALAPLLDAGLVERTGLIVDAASGVTGAGRAAKPDTTFCAVDENFNAYGIGDHRHTPEIEQNLDAQVLFTPHLAPMNRGILATCYARPAAGAELSTATVLAALRDAYASEPFVVVVDGSPGTKATLGANTAHVTARYDERTGTVLAIAAIDNLTKGASGGALQAANVALGLDETLGLPLVGVAP
jgi:N-acetyl-gamma-glutamyl-phosphate reductase